MATLVRDEISEHMGCYNKQPNRLLTCVIKVLNTQGNVIRKFSLRVEVG